MKKLLPALLYSAFLVATPQLHAEAYTTPTGKMIHEQLSSPARSEADRARDLNRKPVQTLEYFGLREDMRVVELLPGKGWYTTILAPVLREKGKLYLSIGTNRLDPTLVESDLLDQVEIVGQVGEFRKTDLPGFIFDTDSVDLAVDNIDLILTFRNLHNLSANARKLVNAAAFAALKPGGIYGVIDHTRRHMEPVNAEIWRRIDPVLVIREMLDAGFEFVDYSDLHAVPADGLVYDTTHESIATNSDRFTFKFRKPD